MKKKQFLTEIKELTSKDIRQKIVELSEELMKLRFRSAVSQLDQTHQFREIKKNIAQARTVLRTKQIDEQIKAA